MFAAALTIISGDKSHTKGAFLQLVTSLDNAKFPLSIYHFAYDSLSKNTRHTR